MLQLWAGTKALFVFTLLQGEIPGGLGGGGGHRIGEEQTGPEGRPLDSYSSAKTPVAEALKVIVRFQAWLSRDGLTAPIWTAE